MNSADFFLGSVLLLGLSWVFRRNIEPHCECGAEQYQRRQNRRLVGNILIVMAGLALVIGAFAILFSGNPLPN